MLHIVLYQPEIPHNTGAVGRLCLATGARLHLIKPLGFSLEDKYLKRSGLDYWAEVDVHVWDDWQAMRDQASTEAEFFYVEVQGTRPHWEPDFSDPHQDLYLVFGPETRGIPPSLMALQPDHVLRIPMRGTRSLNLATAVAITLYEAVRQQGGV
ncbi:tRNA (cytidine/uridine-2'-O-)-methyltransferase [Prosthecobacter debontii]|uniref:Putative tRNA (cytidine(34)-2'-O)-methyltransferase n=1 Tax=Prosthecobacter debontii TaxID=48467 RepID=A0A1T4XLY4_9BACT|nr:tRNA (cytidine(34)-2'-O)-methyltransferase [Prosthecobacter debontii]SKA90572.1 tRNA (cytidine/uridine-2'-O-)-methyltransferase [Prosthecobacter debontii]